MLLVNYKCPECSKEWQDEYECACDSECENCGIDVTAISYQEIPEHDDINEFIKNEFIPLVKQKSEELNEPLISPRMKFIAFEIASLYALSDEKMQNIRALIGSDFQIDF